MGTCKLCGYSSKELSSSVGFCRDCLRASPHKVREIEVHRKWRTRLHLPPPPPASAEGVRCPICVNECRIEDGEVVFCRVIGNIKVRIVHLSGGYSSLLHWYYDPLPTNCVASPVCPATTGRGYPVFTRVNGPEYGKYNLAVFYGGCNLDCLFCQNIEHKYMVSGFRDGRYIE